MNNKLEKNSFFYSSKNIEKIDDGNSNDNDNDDEELEALRLAALQSLQYKKTLRKDLSISSLNVKVNSCFQEHCTKFNHSTVYNNKFSQQINKNLFHHFKQKSNLIEIVPKDINIIVMDKRSQKEHNSSVTKEVKDSQKVSSKSEGKVEKNTVHDDEDIILMSDHEEEDSLERLMDEMEKEINVTQLPEKEFLKSSSTNITSKEQYFSNLKGKNCHRGLKKTSSCSKHRSLSPKSALHVASQEKSRKLIIKPQCHRSQRKSTSIFLHSKLERSLRISKANREDIPSGFGNIVNLKSMKSKTHSNLCSTSSKSILHKNNKSFNSQKYTTENLSTKLMLKNNSYQSNNLTPSNDIFAVEQSNSLHSKKNSISLNQINAHVCCHHYSMICCKRSTCVLKERIKKKKNNKSNGLTNTQILEARRRKFDSIKPINLIDVNKKIRINSKVNEISTNTFSKSNFNVKCSKTYEQNIEEILNSDKNFCNISNEMNNSTIKANNFKKERLDNLLEIQESEVSKKKRRKKENELYTKKKMKNEIYKKKRCAILEFGENFFNSDTLNVDNKGDLRTELSRRRAERLNNITTIQSTRLLQSAFKEVVNEAREKSLRINRRCYFKDQID